MAVFLTYVDAEGGLITGFGSDTVDLLADTKGVPTARLLGRTTAATGAAEAITVGTGLSLSAGTLTCTVTAGGAVTLTGDVTGTGTGTFATTISSNAVTSAKFRQSAALSVVGNFNNATANVADIVAGVDGQTLRRSGTGLSFGALDLSVAAAATGILQAACHPALTGDVTGTAGSTALTLAASGVVAGTYGSGANSAVVTFDAKGRATSAGNSAIAFPTASTLESVLSGTYTIAAANGVYVTVGTGFTVDLTAGTWRVTATVRGLLQVATGGVGYITARLFNVTAAATVANSEVMVIITYGTTAGQNTATITSVITVASTSTIRVEAFRAGGTTYTSTLIASDTDGRTKLAAVRLS